MSDDDETRQQGVEFDDDLGDLDYPIDHADLVADHGDIELELPNGTATLDGVLEPLQDTDQTYQDADELETMIMNMVGDEAIGRKNYSDRDATQVGEERDDEGAPGQSVDDDEQSL